MPLVRPGMLVLTPSGFKPVYFMGEADDTRATSYVILHTTSGDVLTQSGDHFLYADGEHRFTKHIQIGQKIRFFNGSISETHVASIQFQSQVGAYNPYVVGGEIIVEEDIPSRVGISRTVRSCHSSVGLLEGIVADKDLHDYYEMLFSVIHALHIAMPNASTLFYEEWRNKGAISDHPISLITFKAFLALWRSFR